MIGLTLKPYHTTVKIYSLDRGTPHIHAITDWTECVVDVEDDDPLLSKEVEKYTLLSNDRLQVTFEDNTISCYEVGELRELPSDELVLDLDGNLMPAPECPLGKEVVALPDLTIQVTFDNGVIKLYSMESFKELENDDLFQQAKLSPGGYGVIWNDELDLAIEEVWEKGREKTTH